jgi:hypothetical protein
MTEEKRDNTTLAKKAALRRVMLRQMETAPVVMETHGGLGHVWAACYVGVEQGVVFEKDEDKAGYLAEQRPAWAVYEADCVGALKGGAGAHLEVNVLDLDPYGEPWPAMDAFFESERPRAKRVWVVVNDGLRSKVRVGGAWTTGSLAKMVRRYGNDLKDRYLEICRELLAEKAAQAGYSLSRFAGYYCGHGQQMTHYLALLSL